MLHPEAEDHVALRASGAKPVMTPATVAELDLTKSRLRENLHQKWRNRLNRAEKSDLQITSSPMPPDPDHWLFQRETEQQRKRGYKNWPVSFTTAFANTGQTRLFIASIGPTPVAAMLFLRHGASASYHLGYSREEGKHLSAHNLLMWRAMIWLKSQGHSLLDLGTIATNTNPGLARFKLGTGATPRQLGGTWIWPRT